MPRASSQAGPSGHSNGRRSVRASRSRNDDRSSEEEEEERSNAAAARQPSQSQRRAGHSSSSSQRKTASQKPGYVPNGDEEAKRILRKEFRVLIGQTQEARNNLAETRPEDLNEILKRSGALFGQVETPMEGVLDSKLLLNASDIGANLARAMKVDSSFDADSFLSRCATLVGGEYQRDDREYEDDERGPDNEFWRWERLGRRAVMRSKRATTMDHLLGPLEQVYNKRNVQPRRDERSAAGPVQEVQKLQASDLTSTTNETSTLVRQVSRRLLDVGGKNGVNFFRFVLDPDSFANTVENLFYVSFLIREGTASLDVEDESGEPILMGCEPPNEDDYQEGLNRRQIVMELDQDVWEKLVKQYNIRKPMIEPRKEVETANTDTWTKNATSS